MKLQRQANTPFSIIKPFGKLVIDPEKFTDQLLGNSKPVGCPPPPASLVTHNFYLRKGFAPCNKKIAGTITFTIG
jgi:hypothetical protein